MFSLVCLFEAEISCFLECLDITLLDTSSNLSPHELQRAKYPITDKITFHGSTQPSISVKGQISRTLILCF